jgi:hypothetical protein
MAWVCLDYDDTLVHRLPDPMTGEESDQPVEGAVESMHQLAQEGHRLTLFTSRFAPMPDSEKQRLKEQIEQELQGFGFPPIEVWTGTHKPSADVYIGDEAITFDQDWGLALAQLQYMLEERGLVPGPQPDDGGGEVPPEGGQEQPAEQSAPEEEPQNG